MLKNVSKTLIGQIHGLTQRFESQGQSILAAAQTLDSSNARIDSILEGRHAEISALLETVGSKAQDLDKTMRSYSDLIENSLVHAETRAKELSASLAQESAAQSQNVVAEIERLRNDAVSQTAKAAKEIKSSFQTISGQVADQVGMLTSQFDKTADQFGKTADEMRATAHKTADDIEVTRQELQRRMRELPQEAKRSRKVVEETMAAEKAARAGQRSRNLHRNPPLLQPASPLPLTGRSECDSTGSQSARATRDRSANCGTRRGSAAGRLCCGDESAPGRRPTGAGERRRHHVADEPARAATRCIGCRPAAAQRGTSGP